MVTSIEDRQRRREVAEKEWALVKQRLNGKSGNPDIEREIRMLEAIFMPLFDSILQVNERIDLLEQRMAANSFTAFARKNWKGVILGIVALGGLMSGAANVGEIIAALGAALGAGG